MNQPVRDRLNAAVGAVGIPRRPISSALDFPWFDRAIADRGAGQESMREGDCIDERLERGTDLPVCWRQGAIEFALCVVAPADKRLDSAARIVDRNERPFEIRH